MKTTVVITLFNDKRVVRTIKSLQNQTRKPDKILIADGGSPKEFQDYLKNIIKKYSNITFTLLPGRCIDTRRQVVDILIDSTDIIAFIDSDEVAPPNWLKNLVEPIESGKSYFTGGPMQPYEEAHSNAEHILNTIQTGSQKILPEDISYLAMGNSAWHTDVFKKIGNFDATSLSNKTDKDTISGSYHVSDDFDINIRAISAGFKGKFIPDAWIYHDQSHINTPKKLFKYYYGQFVRTAMAYFKHHSSLSKFTKASRKAEIVHPFQGSFIILKPAALIRGWIEWNKHIKGV